MSQITQMINKYAQKIDTINIPYRTDLAKLLFEPIAEHPWAMLLRSASDDHPDSRFDILVAEPIASVITTGEITTVEINGESSVSTEDPFDLIHRYQTSLLPQYPEQEDLPFIGGTLGYFSYDLGRRVERIPSLAENDIDLPDMAVGIYQWSIIVDHKKRQVTAVGVDINKHYQWLVNQKTNNLPDFSLTQDWRSNMTPLSYKNKFNQIQDYLLSGDCYQINLAQRFTAPYIGSEWDAYNKLEASNLAPFSAYLKFETSTVLSVSPERFIQLSGDKIQTKPIKGTRPRSNDSQQDLANAKDLVNAEKDQAENLMIVDLLRNDIGRVAKAGTVQVPNLFAIESFPAVHHLVSTITATLDKQYSAFDLLKACFPGGSITGAPKIRAMEIIEELEPHRRSVYCGSIGYISRCGKMDTSITIRTLITSNGNIHAWAGGGIVADSQCDAEYQETLDKLSRILPIL